VKVSAVIDRIDTGAIALPEFQRGYVWRRRQVRDLVESLYRRFPVGSLLFWETATESAPARGDAPLQRGYVSLLLDGQQRITSLYGLIKGEPPPFFDGDPRAFSDLRFNVDRQEFHFYVPVTMRDDPLWLDVGEVLRRGPGWGMAQLMPVLGDLADSAELYEAYNNRLNRLYGIREIELHGEQITGEDKDIDVVVELFNRVNSGGTKLSKGDLALAKICASWPEARDELKARLAKWDDAGFHFTLEWLLRNVTAIVTGRAEFVYLAEAPTVDVRDGVVAAERAIDVFLNLASSRLGLDHDRVLGGVGAIPVISRYLAKCDFTIADAETADRLLFWYVHCLLWGRYAGSTETVLNIDLLRLEPLAPSSDAADGDPIERLLTELRRQRGDLKIGPDHFEGWSRGARFYPLLYMLSRVSRGRDLRNGLELSQHLLGRHSDLEVHHVFPKAQLYRHGYRKSQVNALANFAFLTAESNRSLGEQLPAAYLGECESRHPGVLASQWIPDDPKLWEIDRFQDFLARRRELLAEAADVMLADLLRGPGQEPVDEPVLERGAVRVWSGDEEEATLARVSEWVSDRGMERGIQHFALLTLDGHLEEGVLDLAWPDGLRFGGERIALLLDEPPALQDIAARHGFRCFTSSEALLGYAEQELMDEAA
jgi:hypothetical protein